MTAPSSTIQYPSVASAHPLSTWQWAIAGIGINLNQPSFPPELKNPVSLRQITGKTFNPAELALEFCAILDKNFRLLYTEGFGPVNDAYQAHLYKKDQPVRFRKGARSFEATVKRVSPAGQLVVEHGTEEEFGWGEVEWIIPGTVQNNVP